MQATIDRIEREIAVLITCGEDPARITVPRKLLPPKSREGDIVSIEILPDRMAADAARERIGKKVEQLSDS